MRSEWNEGAVDSVGHASLDIRDARGNQALPVFIDNSILASVELSPPSPV